MRKAARGHDPGFVATAVGQGLAMDVGFMFQKSKNAARAQRLTGVNSNNAYCIVYDFCSEAIFGVTMRGKTIPPTWLNVLLTRISPRGTPGRIVRLDLGGETGKNPTIQALFIKHGYITQPTSAGASSQNGIGERPHQTVGMAVRVMLHGSGLKSSDWEYDFYFFLRIHAILPHGINKITPYRVITGRDAEVDRLRKFGSHIYALPLARRDGKAKTTNIIEGTLLGYGGSMKNFIYRNNRTKKEGRATHATFDETQLNTPMTDLIPPSLALWGALQRNPGTEAPSTEEIITPLEHFCVFSGNTPFLRVRTVQLPIKFTFDHLGLILETDPISHRNIIVDVQQYSSVSQIDWQ
jgi:hypothetical protein